MHFCHYYKHVDPEKGEQAKRCHGLQLQERWDGAGKPPLQTTPPFRGLPALEVTHPFHIKLTPSMFMGPKCNHDLGILLRILCEDGHSAESATTSMLEAMGDHEYY